MIKKFFLIIIFIFYLSLSAKANIINDINDGTDYFLNNIQSDFNIAEFKNEIIKEGKIPGADTILKRLWDIVFDEGRKAVKELTVLIVPILLFCLISPLDFNKDSGISKCAFIMCYLTVGASLVRIFIDISSLSKETIENIDIFTKSLIPVIFSLQMTLGKVISAATIQPTVIFISQIMMLIINKLIFPLIMLSFTLNFTDNITGKERLSSFSKILRNIVKWSLVFILTFFTAILAAQNILAGSVDNVSVIGIKFAVTNFIPIIGGALSEGVETIGASLKLINNATGIAGIAAVIFIAVIPIIKIYLASITFFIIGALIEPVSGKSYSKTFQAAGEASNLLGLTVISMSFIFIISVSVIIGGLS